MNIFRLFLLATLLLSIVSGNAIAPTFASLHLSITNDTNDAKMANLAER